jgi:trimeric autotransporter adhesin
MQIVLKAQCALLACCAAFASLPALAQIVTVSPTSLSFGNQVEGTTSSAQKVILKNGQSSAITITSITSNLSDYVATTNCPVSPATLAAAATCTIAITFKPSALGARSGTLTVADSGGSSPQLVTLSGTGTAPALVSIAVTPAAPSVAAGYTQQFTATGTYSNGTKQSLTSTATWTSSATTITTVSSGGLATSLVQGTTTITATSGAIQGSATLTVTAPVLASIAVSPSTAPVAAGYTQQFTATGTYSNGTTQNLTSAATWTSSATAIATVRSGGLATCIAKGTATITAASGTIHGSATLTVTAAILTSIAVTPASPSEPAGEKQQFTATGTYSNGTTGNLTSAATWTSSAATIATVTSGGLATSVAPGTTTIAATSGAITGSATLTVTPAVLTSISVTPAAPSVAAGHTQQFTATGTYSNGTKLTLTSTATWTSSATSIATVSGGGLATGVAPGTTTITATLGTISGSATLTVTAAVLTAISVAPGTASVATGYTEQFAATGTYSNGTTQNLTSTATWTSSAATIATVSSGGLATSVAKGAATITATSGTIHGSATLTVTAPVLASIAVSPSTASVAAGYTQQFTATGTYSNGTTQNLTTTATWTSSATGIGTVSGGGLATSLVQGNTTITATSGTITGSATLAVTLPVLVSLAVNPGSASIAKGGSQQFAVTGTYSDGSRQNLTSSVGWTSSSAVASIASGGLASGQEVGAATITATSGSISGSATLSVGQAVLVAMAVTPTNASLAMGTTLPLVATGTYSDGSTLVVTNTAGWSTADSSFATVNNQGVAGSVALGSTTVTATLGTISGVTTVTVNPAVLVSIAVTPAVPVIPLGTAQTFTATGTYTDGSTQNISSTVEWSSDTTGVSTISTGGPTPGVASGGGVGSANITASEGGVSGSTTVTVTGAALVSIAVNPAMPTIALGTTQQFTATGTYTDGTTQDLSSTATWSSDTATTATINSTGLGQSVGSGTATVSATSGTVSGSTVLTVTGAALVSIAITPATATIAMGTTQQFTATGTFTDGTTQDLTQSGNWSSTAATVATISDTAGTMGEVSTTGMGTTTIGISSGTVSGTATLVVNPAALVSIALNPPAATIALGTTQQFTATGTYTDGSAQDLTSVVTWSTSSATVAIMGNGVGSYGLATSAGQGTANITASLNASTASGTLSVTGPTLISIAITPNGAALPLGTGQQFDAVGIYTDGSTQDLTQSATWASSIPGVATIGAPGYAGSVAPGTTMITATSGTVTGSVVLVVNSAVPISLIVTPASSSILVGAQQQFGATLNYSNGSSVSVTSAVTWSSSNSGVATVNSSGLAVGVTGGSSVIEATWGANVFTTTGSLTVSVPIPNIWYVSPAGSNSNNCLSGGTACLTIAHAESLSAAGDTINIGAGTYRLSPGGSSTTGSIPAKSNQTFVGPACTPTSGPCQAVISGGISIAGLALGPDASGNWYVTGQTQHGAVNSSASCDTGWGGCIYPEDLFFNGVPLQHVVASSESTLTATQWWFDYTNHIIYFHQNPEGNTVETSVLETAFSPNGANNITINGLTFEEFASPVQSGAIDPAYGTTSNSNSSTNWTIENSYLTLNHGAGIRVAFGMQVLNSVLTNNGNFGTGGGPPAGNIPVTPSGVVIQGNTVTYNNYAHVSPAFGAGGMKFGNAANVIVRGNTVNNNIGDAIDFDSNSWNPLIDGNTVQNNVDPGNTGGTGIVCEIGEGGCTIRNNVIQFEGKGGTVGVQSSTTSDAQAYCNVVTQTGNSNVVWGVNTTDRGYFTNTPNLGAYIVSAGNWFHHNTIIWNSGQTGQVGYYQNDTTNQPNFFANNTPPDYNAYHGPSTSVSQFVYDNNDSGSNTPKTFASYQAEGADVHGTFDTLYTSGFPTVSITSPADQSFVTSPVTVAATASDASGINNVELYVDWNLAATATSSPYNFTLSGLTPGAHTVAAIAYSNAGIRNCYAVTLNP